MCSVLRVDALHGLSDLAHVVAIDGDILARRLQKRPELDPALELGVMGEELLVRQKAAHDVLRRIRAVDADDQVLRPPVAQLSLLDHHAV